MERQAAVGKPLFRKPALIIFLRQGFIEADQFRIGAGTVGIQLEGCFLGKGIYAQEQGDQ
ncbi:hypothetical protein D9M69_531350 [compost metagenome]